MNFYIMTLFPDMVMQGLNTSIIGRAAEKGLLTIKAVNIRDYTINKHKKVDDYPYGGGAGMLMQAQPVYDAWRSIVDKIGTKPRTIYLTPQGPTFTQQAAKSFAKEENLIFLCGHYEGIDERVLEEIVTDYVSIGDYVLTGGELPAMVMVDAISRLIPGVLHNDVSAEFESFQDDLLEYPQYSRPEEWHGKKVGSIADFSNFSFHAVKNFTTAEGGAATWKDIEGIDNEELYHKYQLLSLHGQSKDALAKTQLGAWEYDIVGPWYKCNMTDVVAGIGLAQMKRYKGLLARRKEIIGKYDAAFKPLGIQVLDHYNKEHQSSGHLYITRVPGITLEQRHEIIVKMAEAGVACNVHYKPLPMMTAYKDLGFDIKDYPNAYKQFENEITLPLHTKLTDEEVDYVIEQYCKIVKEYL